jgi:hypothetical protein
MSPTEPAKQNRAYSTQLLLSNISSSILIHGAPSPEFRQRVAGKTKKSPENVRPVFHPTQTLDNLKQRMVAQSMISIAVPDVFPEESAYAASTLMVQYDMLGKCLYLPPCHSRLDFYVRVFSARFKWVKTARRLEAFPPKKLDSSRYRMTSIGGTAFKAATDRLVNEAPSNS